MAGHDAIRMPSVGLVLAGRRYRTYATTSSFRAAVASVASPTLTAAAAAAVFARPISVVLFVVVAADIRCPFVRSGTEL